jgi:hypothetical protein
MINWLTRNGKVFKNIEDAHYLANKESYKKYLYLLTQYGRYKVVVKKEKVECEFNPNKYYINYYLEKVSEVDVEGNNIKTITVWK